MQLHTLTFILLHSYFHIITTSEGSVAEVELCTGKLWNISTRSISKMGHHCSCRKTLWLTYLLTARGLCNSTLKRIYLKLLVESLAITDSCFSSPLLLHLTSMTFIHKGPIDTHSSMVQVMAWRRTGDKPLPGPIMTKVEVEQLSLMACTPDYNCNISRPINFLATNLTASDFSSHYTIYDEDNGWNILYTPSQNETLTNGRQHVIRVCCWHFATHLKLSLKKYRFTPLKTRR